MTTKRTLRRRLADRDNQIIELRMMITELRGEVHAAESLMTGFRRGLSWTTPPADTAARAAGRAGTPLPGAQS